MYFCFKRERLYAAAQAVKGFLARTGQRPQLFLLYSLIIHSSMNLFFTTLQAVYTLFFPESLRHE